MSDKVRYNREELKEQGRVGRSLKARRAALGKLLGKHLHGRRTALGKTRQQIEREAPIAAGAMSRYEQGRIPAIDTLMMLAAPLACGFLITPDGVEMIELGVQYLILADLTLHPHEGEVE